MANTAATVPEEQHPILSNLSPGPGQRRLALAVVLALLVAFVITAGPLSTVQPGADRRLCPSLRDRDLRNRSNHRCAAVRTVLYPALGRSPCDREWISLYGAYRDPVDVDLSQGIGIGSGSIFGRLEA